MKTRHIAILSLVLLLMAGCKKDTFTICGTLDNGANKTLYLEEIAPEGPLFIDSIRTDGKGYFKYTYKMPYKSLYNLHTSAYNYIVTLPDYGEKIEIEGDWNNLSMTYNVSGSRESILLWQLQQFSNDGGRGINDLVDTTEYYRLLNQQGLVDDATVALKKQQTDSIYRLLFAEQQDYVCHFIEENKGSLSTLIALYKPFNNYPLIDSRRQESMEWYDIVLEGLQETMPDNPHTLHFKNTTEHVRSALSREE